ncbi:MAG: T9SS type A sorting domain-containing protein [Salibacteraceae bacterium]
MFLVITSSFGQLQWGKYDLNLNDGVTTIYTDTVNDLLYIGGRFSLVNGDTTPGITVYNGTSWDSIGSWFGVGSVFAIAVYHDTLFIGGYQGSLGGLKMWDGTDWIAVGGTEVYGQVYDLEVINDELWVAGNFDSIGSVPAHGVARWDGTEWKTAYDLPGGLTGGNSPNWIVEVVEYKDEVYIGGNLNNEQFSEIARWDGLQWKDVGGGIKRDGFSGISRMVEHDSDLFVMGSFLTEMGNVDQNIMRWNGQEWLRCGGGTGGSVYDAIVHQDNLWVTGSFNFAGGASSEGLAMWDGEQWCSPGNELRYLDSNQAWPAGIGVYRDTLVLGGGFTTIDGDSFSFLANWSGEGKFDTCGVLWPVGEEEALLEMTGEIRVYPNPVNDKLSIELPKELEDMEVIISIYAIDGRMMSQRSVKGNKGLIVLPTENLNYGVYLLNIFHDLQSESIRFVKQ